MGVHDVVLHHEHPTACYFIDESGRIANDRFFAVGMMKLDEPSALFRDVQRLRDRHNFREAFHFTDLTRSALPIYKGLVDVIAAHDGWFFRCFVADKQVANPVDRWGTHWVAYEKLAEQIMVAGVKPYEIVSAVADQYSSPAHVRFEIDVRRRVNRRLDRCAVATLFRADTRATEGLQLVDVILGAVAFSYRSQNGRAKTTSHKAKLAGYVRSRLAPTVTGFTDIPLDTDRFSVRMYDHGRWSPTTDSRAKG